MILVADASALIALSVCDSLTLLDALFSNVVVPEAVYREVAVAGKPESVRLQSYLQGMGMARWSGGVQLFTDDFAQGFFHGISSQATA